MELTNDKMFGERARPGRSLTRLASNMNAIGRTNCFKIFLRGVCSPRKIFCAGRAERQPGRLRSPIPKK